MSVVFLHRLSEEDIKHDELMENIIEKIILSKFNLTDETAA
jgi:hypothetical protein